MLYIQFTYYNEKKESFSLEFVLCLKLGECLMNESYTYVIQYQEGPNISSCSWIPCIIMNRNFVCALISYTSFIKCTNSKVK